jgi:hypothetical protein
MDLGKALRDLYAERQRLEHIIATLQERRQGDATTPPLRRGPTEAAGREPVTEPKKRCRTDRRPSGSSAA